MAVCTFAKTRSKITILLRIDNMSAVAYMNNKGGTVSQDLVNLTKDLCMWCLERNIHIIAQHLLGILKHHHRHGVPDNGGPVGLKAERGNLPVNRAAIWPNRSGPICIQTNNSVLHIFQLAARSACSSYRECMKVLQSGIPKMWNGTHVIFRSMGLNAE